MDVKEKRKHRRVPFVSKVSYILADNVQYYYSQDLSVGGMFLETKKPFPVGAKLELDFPLPETDSRIRVRGQVVRVTKPNPAHYNLVPGMGIVFIEVNPDTYAMLEEFLKE